MGISFYYERIPVVIAVVMIALLLLKYRKISNITLMMLVYYVFLAVISQLRGWGIPLVLTNVCPSICMILLCEYGFKSDKLLLFKTLGVLLSSLMVVDFITMLLYPEGMYTAFIYSNNWFLGYKTERINISLPGVVFLCEYSKLRYGKIKLYVWVMAAIAIVTAFWADATSGSVTVLFFTAFMVLLGLKEKKKAPKKLVWFLKPNFVLTILIVANFLIAIVQNLSMFEYIIVNVLGKSMNLTGRTNIWNVCKLLFLQNPILGNGFINSGNFAIMTGTAAGTQPHNLLWTLLVYSGIVGTVIYMGAVLVSFNKLGKWHTPAAFIMAYYILANVLLGISSMNTYSPMFTAAIPLLWHLKTFETAELVASGRLQLHEER